MHQPGLVWSSRHLPALWRFWAPSSMSCESAEGPGDGRWLPLALSHSLPHPRWPAPPGASNILPSDAPEQLCVGPALIPASPPARHLSTLGLWQQEGPFFPHVRAPAARSPLPAPCLVALYPPCAQPGTAGRIVGPRQLAGAMLEGIRGSQPPLKGVGHVWPHFISEEGGG